MGWTKICDLNAEYSLWSRGGIQGVMVKRLEKEEIHIPYRVLLPMFLEEIRHTRVRHYEQILDTEMWHEITGE
ncbi:MAG: hypothetical protein Q8P12_05515 [bacterium]|nr:hypothetical protein [bacterium]